MDFIDLHVHSAASDGSCSPKELVRMALEKGLYAIAITDHDTINGIVPAIEAAEGTPLKVIPGIEFSCQHDGNEVHVLGYNFDIYDPDLNATIDDMIRIRNGRNERMCELLNEHGVNVTMKDVALYNKDAVITRAAFAEFLVDSGYCETNAEAFDKYIGDKACCFVPRTKLDIKSAAKLIKNAHGIVSLAHPVQYHMSEEECIQLFDYCRSCGVDCVEVYHSDNTQADTIKFEKLAEYAGLKPTGGSDFHGTAKPDIVLGTGRGNIMVPKTILNNIGIRTR